MTRALLGAVACLSLALSAPSAQGQQKTRIRRQIARLQHPDETVRKNAQLALVKASDRAIPGLLTALGNAKHAAFRQRLLDTLRQICTANIRSIRPPGGRGVTLKQDRTRVSKALAALRLQTGNPITLAAGAPDREIELALDNTAFFPALKTICRAGGYGSRVSPKGGRLLFSGTPPANPTIFRGPFRIRIVRIRRVWRKDFDAKPTTEAQVQLQVDWGRGFSLLGQVSPVRIVSARDDRGTQLAPPRAAPERFDEARFLTERSAFGVGSREGGVEIWLRLWPFSLKAGRIARLAGQLTLVFVKEARVVRIPAPEKLQNFKLTFPGGFYELRSIARRGDAVTLDSRFELPVVKMPLKLDGRGIARLLARPRAYRVQYLVDQKGQRYRSGGEGTSGRGVVSARSSYAFPRSKKLAAVVLHYVREIQIRRVNFEFKDIPLR